jgi:phosphoribosylformylglycinamidine cyclo-ligase
MQNKGGIQDKEMYHTFNMGIGMVLMAKPYDVQKIIGHLASHGLKSWVIGDAIKGRKEVEIV